MKYALPAYIEGHAAALLGVVALHAGIAAWAMQPQAPISMPQQHILQVAMVTPALPRVSQMPVEKTVPQVEKLVPATKPLAKKGMVKAKPAAQRKVQAQQPTPQPVQHKPIAQQPETQVKTAPIEQAMLQPADAAETRSAAFSKPVAAAYLNNPAPDYPRRARNRRQQGTVMLEVMVSPTGRPNAIVVAQSSGYSTLDNAAQDAVKRWQFVPARRGSTHVAASVIVPIEFRIN